MIEKNKVGHLGESTFAQECPTFFNMMLNNFSVDPYETHSIREQGCGIPTSSALHIER